jgi:hypothetical protein
MSFMVVAVNAVALGWPFVHKVLSGKLADYYQMTKDVYHWCCSKYTRWCGNKEERAKIAVADAKIKKRKQKEKQRSKEAVAAAKAARVNTGAQTQATLTAEMVFRHELEQTSVAGESGIVSERQIPEITAPPSSRRILNLDMLFHSDILVLLTLVLHRLLHLLWKSDTRRLCQMLFKERYQSLIQDSKNKNNESLSLERFVL